MQYLHEGLSSQRLQHGQSPMRRDTCPLEIVVSCMDNKLLGASMDEQEETEASVKSVTVIQVA